MRAWFTARSLREQRMILAMLALAAATLIWAAVVIPVRDGLASARSAHRDAVERLGVTLNEVAAVKRAQRAGIALPEGPLADTVRARAEEAGFTLAGLDQDGADRVKVSIGTARPPALFAWIAALEQAGILVESSAITGNGDQTVAAQLTLRARAA
jgi:general secretion pathway protein M